MTADGRAYLLRPASDRDADQLVALHDSVAAEREYIAAVPGERTALEETLTLAALLAEGGLSIVIEADARVVGHLVVHRGTDTDAMHRGDLAIIVANTHRDVGLGRLLMETAIEWACAVGMTRLSLGVFTTNVRAIGLYRSLGFADLGVRRARMPPPEGERELLLMGLALQG